MLLGAELRRVDKENRMAEFVITDETPDRHGSIVTHSGWDLTNYKKNPIVSYNHAALGFLQGIEPNPDFIIGSSKLYDDKENKQLLGTVNFEDGENNPLAEKIFQKVLNGILRTASVGFIPKEGGTEFMEGDNGEMIRVIKQKELLEWSIVDVPSNPNATAKQLEEMEARYYTFDNPESAEEGYPTDVYRYKLKLEENET